MSSLIASHLPTVHHAVISAILLNATTTTTKAKTSSSSSYLFLFILIGVAMYLLFIRPRSQAARRQQMQQQQQGAKVGDRVVTTAGIIGRVQGFIGDRVQLEISEGVTIEVLRQAIGRRLPDEIDDDDMIPPPPGADELEDEDRERDEYDEHGEHDEHDEHDDVTHAAADGEIEELPAYADEESGGEHSAGEESGDEESAGEESGEPGTDDEGGGRSRWRRTRK